MSSTTTSTQSKQVSGRKWIAIIVVAFVVTAAILTSVFAHMSAAAAACSSQSWK